MPKLLIVEDDPYVRRLFERLFAFQKYQVATAKDGEEAKQKAESFVPDLILLDIIMPKISGLDVLRALKTNEKTKAIPVVMLTNDNDEQTIKTAADLGARGYMIKSDFTPEEVLNEVHKYLDLTTRSDYQNNHRDN